jgi:hypothetical protein
MQGWPAREAWARTSQPEVDQFERPFELQLAEHRFVFAQSQITRDKRYGNTVWDGALVLAHYCLATDEFPQGYWQGKRVIELVRFAVRSHHLACTCSTSAQFVRMRVG